ncbi:MAG TPA: ABC transporter ATP-binding protein [Chloroflexia bacterium]|jgi:ABC-type branched-subunit amino acid transport system ATPase component
MTSHVAETPAREPILTVRDLTRSFGGLVAVNNVSFDIYPGEIYGLIGPNGAGKTTVLNILSGLLTPTSGTVTFQGHRIERSPAYRIARQGVARTYQNIRLFAAMNVLQNVIVGQHSRMQGTLAERLVFSPRVRRQEEIARQKALALLESVDLAGVAEEPASALAYGNQRRLELVRALASDPKLLLLDEPAAGMNAAESQALGGHLRDLAVQGITLLVIEHDMALVMSLCDRIGVLNFGNLIAEGTPEEIAGNPLVIEAYLGAEE